MEKGKKLIGLVHRMIFAFWGGKMEAQGAEISVCNSTMCQWKHLGKNSTC